MTNAIWTKATCTDLLGATGPTLFAEYVNDRGERCFRSSRIAKGETEEQAKVRIMAVTMYDDNLNESLDDDGPVGNS